MRKDSVYKSPKQFEILNYLYRVRGATIVQIVKGLDRVEINERNYYNRQLSRYEHLRKLQSKGLVTRMPSLKNEHAIYYLTKEGLELMQLEYGLEEGDRGTGYGEDYGFIPYGLHRPPRNRVKHFSMQTDIQNIVMNLKEEQPGIFDYRDNLHSAVSYHTSKNIRSVNFRPDGELLINDNNYVIEADLVTEQGKQLSEKFEGYRKYFDYLQKEDKPLPNGVIFVFPNRPERFKDRIVYPQGQMRFGSILSNFRRFFKDYEHTFFLYCVELKDFDSRIKMLLPGNQKELFERALSHIQVDGKMLNIRTSQYEGYPILSIKRGAEDFYFLLQEVEGYTNVAWINGFKIYKELIRKYPHLKVISYYSQFHTIPPVSRGAIGSVENPEYKNYFKSMYFLNAGGKYSLWYDHNHKVLDAPPF